jgi:hypothetical protein
MDPHHFGNLDPDPHQKIPNPDPHQSESWIWNRIWIRINLQMTS